EARLAPVPTRLQQILDRALRKDPRDRYQKIAEFRDDLKAVVRELMAGSGAPLDDSGALVAPRHLNTQGPMSRAMRWLKNIRSSEASSGSYARTGSAKPSPQVHETPTS